MERPIAEAARPDEAPNRRDQLLVTAAAVVWLLGTAIGFGLLGGDSVQQQGDGLFSDSATLIAPYKRAFSIWSVIYVFLAGYVVWQWMARRSAWAGVTRVPAAWSLALNGVWLFVVFRGWIAVSVLVMAGIVASLGVILARTATLPDDGWGPRVWVSGTFGLYLGWISVATCANVAVWLVALGVPAAGRSSELITLAVLGVVVGIAAFLAHRTTHLAFRAALVAALTWGLFWAGYGRHAGALRSDLVGVAAYLAAALVVAAGVGLTLRGRSERHVVAP